MNFELVLPSLRHGATIRRTSRPGILIALEPAIVADANEVPSCFKAQAIQARELYVAPSFVSLWEDVIMPYSFTTEDLLASDWQVETQGLVVQVPVQRPIELERNR